MLRNPTLRCLLAAALTVTAWTSAARAADNLLANPGLEEGRAGHAWIPAAWDTSAAGLPSVFFGRDGALTHDGDFAISVANASALWPMEHFWHQSVAVDERHWGKDLVLTIWTRSLGVEGRGFVALQALQDSAGKMALAWGVPHEEAEARLGFNRMDNRVVDLGFARAVFTENETDWVRRELRVFLPPSTNIVMVRAGILGVGQIYFDDASVTLEPALPAVEPAPGVNLIVNGGFEEDLSSWEISYPPFTGYEIGPSPIAHTGERSMGFAGGAGLLKGRAGVAQVFCNRALAGKRLRLTGYAKSDSLLSSANARLYCHGINQVAQEVSTQMVSGTVDWTQVTAELDVPPDTYAVWAWLSFASPAKGRIYFDDVSLEIVGPAKSR